ncbi:MAG: virulence-associated E family protein [Gallionellaceae bacterium]|jgi:predicted P-loop ATPase
MGPTKKQSLWSPIVPVTPDAPAARLRHGTRGDPLRTFEYRNQENQLLGYTARFMTSSGEAVHLPLTWCKDLTATDIDYLLAWRWIQFPRFRPLYGLEQLSEDSPQTEWHVIVFDENEAEAAKKLIPWAACFSWPGGIRKIDEVDWSPLRGLTNIFIWPTLTQDRIKVRRDEDAIGEILPRDKQSGWRAALKIEKILLGFGCKIKGIVDPFFTADIPNRIDFPAGFGAAMADLQKWDENSTDDFLYKYGHGGLGTELQQCLRKKQGHTEHADPLPESREPELAPTGAAWELRLLRKNGELIACLANVHDILANAPEWQGVIAFNQFEMRVVKLKPPPYHGGTTGEWDSTDDTCTAMELSRVFKFTPSSALVLEAVEVIARRNGFHPVRLWLRGLKWDGVPRLNDWMVDCFGIPKTDYSSRVSRWFPIGMVARVMSEELWKGAGMYPGVKFDYCLVLEGTQGRMKSTALSVLGGEWFGDTDINLDNKDSMSAIRGKWLYEFQELGSLAKHEASKQKSFISRMIDEFRPVYGRREIRIPRQGVFAGTTNDWEWNKDPTGGRRFWPVMIEHDINIKGLREIRDQLFAEAMVCFEAGEKFWPDSKEQREIFDPEQLKREQQDSLIDALHDWVYQQVNNFSIASAAIDGLKMDASKLTRDLQTRIGISLRKLGCERVEKRNGMIRYWYKPPQKTATSNSNIPALKKDDDDEPF